MTKTYKSQMTSLRILVKVGKEIIPVAFGWDLIYPNSSVRGCSFTTDDVELQKALEAHECFNRKLQPNFWTDDVEEAKETKEEVLDEPKKVKRYKSKE
jgi:hypothetical protein